MSFSSLGLIDQLDRLQPEATARQGAPEHFEVAKLFSHIVDDTVIRGRGGREEDG